MFGGCQKDVLVVVWVVMVVRRDSGGCGGGSVTSVGVLARGIFVAGVTAPCRTTCAKSDEKDEDDDDEDESRPDSEGGRDE